MTMDAPTLYPTPADVEVHGGKGLHGYYRNIRGWIVVQSTTPSNRSGTEFKGGRFLPQYGEFINGTSGGAAKAQDDRGMPWNAADEPWRLILQRGGAREFPVEQVLAYRWHIRPPYREVEFPQLEGVEVHDLYCPECDKGIFSSTDRQTAVDQLRVHLTSQINLQHSYRPEDLRVLGERESIDFFSRGISARPITRSSGRKAAQKGVGE